MSVQTLEGGALANARKKGQLKQDTGKPSKKTGTPSRKPVS